MHAEASLPFARVLEQQRGLGFGLSQRVCLRAVGALGSVRLPGD